MSIASCLTSYYQGAKVGLVLLGIRRWMRCSCYENALLIRKLDYSQPGMHGRDGKLDGNETDD